MKSISTLLLALTLASPALANPLYPSGFRAAQAPLTPVAIDMRHNLGTVTSGFVNLRPDGIMDLTIYTTTNTYGLGFSYAGFLTDNCGTTQYFGNVQYPTGLQEIIVVDNSTNHCGNAPAPTQVYYKTTVYDGGYPTTYISSFQGPYLQRY